MIKPAKEDDLGDKSRCSASRREVTSPIVFELYTEFNMHSIVPSRKRRLDGKPIESVLIRTGGGRGFMFGSKTGENLTHGFFNITVEILFGAGDEVMDTERTGWHLS